MKALLYLALALATAALATAAHAQRPSGYLGKRHLAEVSVDYNPYQFVAEGLDGFSSAPGLSVHYRYVVRPRLSVGAYARFGESRVDPDGSEGPRERIAGETRQVAALIEFAAGRGGIAPLGLFWEFGLGHQGLAYERIPSNSVLTEDANDRGGVFGLVGLGYRYVFADRLALVTYGRVCVGGTHVGTLLDNGDQVLATGETAQFGVRLGLLL